MALPVISEVIGPVRRFRSILLTILIGLIAAPSAAVERIEFFAQGASDSLRKRLASVSLLAEARATGVTDPADLMAAARADYAQLIEALYAEGHYGPEISITIDGREAAAIPAFEEPESIAVIRVFVRPGARFVFAEAQALPLGPGTVLPDGFRRGAVARTTVLIDAAAAAVEAWEDAGHPKADVGGQDLAVRHAASEMDARIFIDPGPRLAFGGVTWSGNERVRDDAIRRILGWPEGDLVTPANQGKAADRLRRTGAFRSVVLQEAEQPNSDGTLNHELLLVEDKPRRFGVGGELSTEEGLSLSAYWLHRNILGGAERLRFDGEVSGIAGETGGIDYGVSARFERPGTFFVDTDLFVELGYTRLDEPDYTSDVFEAGVGLKRIVNDQLSQELGVGLYGSTVTDATGTNTYRLLTLPGRLTWTNRDDELDATEGVYLDAELMPFLGFADAGSGLRATLDARAYFKPNDESPFVFAARGQLGSVIGPAIGEVPADLRFFSGGGGTVRGQPYQSLGVDLAGDTTGGLSFAAISAEVRARLSETIGAVAFLDVGFVGDTGLPGESGAVNAGAGLGLRYNTGLGPIRLDVAVPVTSSTGDTLFFYVGIGQAF